MKTEQLEKRLRRMRQIIFDLDETKAAKCARIIAKLKARLAPAHNARHRAQQRHWMYAAEN